MEMENSHVALTLLRQCSSYFKMVYFIRTCPHVKLGDILHRFDDKVRESLSEIIGQNVGGDAWMRAGLSIKAGGLGLRHVVDHCSSAYLSSLSAAHDIFPQISLLSDSANSAVDHINERVSNEDKVVLGGYYYQNEVSASIDIEKARVLLSGLSPVERGKWVSLWGAGASAYLQGVPNIFLGTEMALKDFKVAIRVRLSLELFVPGQCPEGSCLEFLDRWGDHALCCRCGGDLCSRHNAIAKCFYAECEAASLQPKLKLSNMVPGTLKRPGDVVVSSFADCF